jgi:hypothetical protein
MKKKLVAVLLMFSGLVHVRSQSFPMKPYNTDPDTIQREHIARMRNPIQGVGGGTDSLGKLSEIHSGEFGKTSAGLRIGYSGLRSVHYGFLFSTPFSSDEKLWNFVLNADNYVANERYQLTLRVNIGRNIPVDENLNWRAFVGVGDWILATNLSPRPAHLFPIMNFGFSLESDIGSHLIVFLTVEQQVWIPYSLLLTPTAFLIGSRFYL